MKTAIYIEDGVVQLVITPETEFEKNSLSTFRDKAVDAEIFSGTFYDCRGGWVRQTAYKERDHFSQMRAENDSSLIIKVNEATEALEDG